MSTASAAEYYEYHESRESLEDPGDGHWVKCETCEEFLVTDEALKLDGLWFHPACLSDRDRVRAIEAEESEGLTEEDEVEVV